MSYTKGPWSFSKRGQRIYGGGLGGVKIAQVNIGPDWQDNGALLASAPALLEALEKIDMQVSHGKLGDWSIALDEIRKITRAAIASALGADK